METFGRVKKEISRYRSMFLQIPGTFSVPNSHFKNRVAFNVQSFLFQQVLYLKQAYTYATFQIQESFWFSATESQSWLFGPENFPRLSSTNGPQAAVTWIFAVYWWCLLPLPKRGKSMVQPLSEVELLFLGCLFKRKINRSPTVVERLLIFIHVLLRANSFFMHV